MAPASRSRNLLLTGVASVALLASLFILVPHGAQATKVLLQPSGVAQPLSDFSFDVVATVTIPAGERVPLSYAEVLVNDLDGSFSNGRLDGNVCSAYTPAGVQILSIGGGASTFGNFTATRHNVTTGTGYGLDGNGYGVDYGYGYGYGSSTTGMTLVIRLRVSGCLGAPDFAGGPIKTFDVQVFFGADAARTFPSVPVRVTLFDPAFTAPATNEDLLGSSLVPGTPSSAGGQAGITFTFTDTDGDAILFEPVPTGTTIGPVGFPAGLGAASGVSFSVTTKQSLPAGTQLMFTFVDEGVLDPLHPPFGVNPAILGGTLRGKAPALYFQVLMSIPGEGFVSAGPYLELTITLRVGDGYFSASQTAPGRFTMAAFTAEGTLKPIQPQFVPPVVRDGETRLFTFRITDFSSFVGYGRPGGGTTIIVDPEAPAAVDPSPNQGTVPGDDGGTQDPGPQIPGPGSGPGTQNGDGPGGDPADPGSGGPGSEDGRSADERLETPASGLSGLWLALAGILVLALLVGGLVLMRRK